MASAPVILKVIKSIREIISSPETHPQADFALEKAPHDLSQKMRRRASDRECLVTVLDFAGEIETYRGKGSQYACLTYAEMMRSLAYCISDQIPTEDDFSPPEKSADSQAEKTKEVLSCMEMMAAHSFSRTELKKSRSQHASRLKAEAWQTLDCLLPHVRRQEHFERAQVLIGNSTAHISEREAALEYLCSYWAGEDPDENTAALLEQAVQDPPDRDFLVSVLNAQINLGLNDEFGALCGGRLGWSVNFRGTGSRFLTFLLRLEHPRESSSSAESARG